MHSNAPGSLWFHTFKFYPGLTNVQLLSSIYLLMESGFFSLSTLKPKYFAMKVQGNRYNVACLFKENVNKNFRMEIIGSWQSKLNLKIKPLSQYTTHMLTICRKSEREYKDITEILLTVALNTIPPSTEYEECFDCPSPWKFKLSQNNTHDKLQ